MAVNRNRGGRRVAIADADAPRRQPVIRNFSAIEDKPKDAVLSIGQIAGRAGRFAALAARNMGLPKVYATNSQIIRVSADGKSREVIATPSQSTKTFFHKYAKGTVLHARKK